MKKLEGFEMIETCKCARECVCNDFGNKPEPKAPPKSIARKDLFVGGKRKNKKKQRK